MKSFTKNTLNNHHFVFFLLFFGLFAGCIACNNTSKNNQDHSVVQTKIIDCKLNTNELIRITYGPYSVYYLVELKNMLEDKEVMVFDKWPQYFMIQDRNSGKVIDSVYIPESPRILKPSEIDTIFLSRKFSVLEGREEIYRNPILVYHRKNHLFNRQSDSLIIINELRINE